MRQLPQRPDLPPRSPANTAPSLGRKLSNEQKLFLFENGFLVLRDYVSKEAVASAKRLINQELGYGLSKEDLAEGAKGSYCKRVAGSAPITSLFNSSQVYGTVKQLISKTNPVFGGQIALRFPGQLCTDKEHFIPAPWWNGSWHIDGFSDENNGIPPGEIKNFTALIGVALSDTPADFCGNLVVYPRSHFILQKYFRGNGFEEAKKGMHALPGIQLPPPVQIHLNAGDIIIAQYMLAHTIAPNTSPNVRYQIYFRVNARQGDFHHPEPMLNMWLDWDGMKDIVDTHHEDPLVEGVGATVKPFYVDQRRKEELALLIEKDEKLGELKKKAEELFDQNQFDASQPLWAEVADHFANDWSVQLKAACSFTFGNDKNVSKGEKYCKNMITLLPHIAVAHCIYAKNLNLQKKHKETIQIGNQVLSLPPSAEKDSLARLLEAMIDSFFELQTPNTQIEDFIQRLASIYPQYQTEAFQFGNELKKKHIWKEGHVWVQSPHKDLVLGETIFQRIVSADPTDFWGTLLYGGCLSWNRKLPEGESYLRKAIQLDNTVPHGFSALAQNLLWQGKHSETIGVVRDMMKTRFQTIETTQDHREKLFEALDCVKQVCGLSSTEMKNFVHQAKVHYPSLEPQLSHFEKTGTKG